MDNIEKVPNQRLWCSASKYKILILSQVSRLPHQKQEIKNVCIQFNIHSLLCGLCLLILMVLWEIFFKFLFLQSI